MHYAISTGDALHTLPADSHQQFDDGALVIHGREDHTYGPEDWDLVCWADSREQVYDMIGRIRLAPRLQDY